MPTPLPFPTPWSIRRATPLIAESPYPFRRASLSLVSAVAAVVAIAAERARAAGDLGALRDAIEAALNAATPPPGDERADLPRIADADLSREALCPRALLTRSR